MNKCTCYGGPGTFGSQAVMGDKITCMICHREITTEADQAWRALQAEEEANFWERRFNDLFDDVKAKRWIE